MDCAVQLPSKEQVAALSADLRSRAALPDHVNATLKAMHPDTHPMTQFSAGVLALQVSPYLCLLAVRLSAFVRNMIAHAIRCCHSYRLNPSFSRLGWSVQHPDAHSMTHSRGMLVLQIAPNNKQLVP